MPQIDLGVTLGVTGSGRSARTVRMLRGAGEIDVLCEYAISFLLSGQGDAKALGVVLARADPARAPLELIFVLASAVASIEDVLSGPETSAIAVETWRIGALLGVELHMMQLLGRPSGTCRDLVHYWQTEDPYFLGGAV